MGAIAVSIINVITSRIRPGWTYTLGALLCLLTYPFILLVMYKLGPRWRKIRRERERLRIKEESANEKGEERNRGEEMHVERMEQMETNQVKEK